MILVMHKFTWQQYANIGETWGHIKPSELSIHIPEALTHHWIFGKHVLHSTINTLPAFLWKKKGYVSKSSLKTL